MVDIQWVYKMDWKRLWENHSFLNCLEIFSMHAVEAISDWDGAVWTMDEEVGPNLVVVVGLVLPDIVAL